MTAQSQGPAQIASASNLALDAPSMNMGGGAGSATSATMQGTFQLTQGDIIAEMASLRNHVHVCPACGAETRPPVGSGASAAGFDSAAGSGGSSGNDGNETGGNENNGNDSEGESQDGENSAIRPSLELSPEYAAALAATGYK